MQLPISQVLLFGHRMRPRSLFENDLHFVEALPRLLDRDRHRCAPVVPPNGETPIITVSNQSGAPARRDSLVTVCLNRITHSFLIRR